MGTAQKSDNPSKQNMVIDPYSPIKTNFNVLCFIIFMLLNTKQKEEYAAAQKAGFYLGIFYTFA